LIIQCSDLRIDQLAAFLREQGIARLAEIRRAGITAATVSRLKREGFVIKLGRGLLGLAARRRHLYPSRSA
jgi:Transcriptional regulator, AbiEi antitoxin